MKLYHIERDHTLTLKEFKNRIRAEYIGIVDIIHIGRNDWTVIAEGKKGE